MNSHNYSVLGSHSSLRKPAIVLGLISLTAILAITVFAESWEKKDWRQWTKDNCSQILHSSPWAVQGPMLGDYNGSHDRGGEPAYFPYALIMSSLPIRQALERQAQLDEHYDKMSVPQRQEFDAITAECFGTNYGDRIVVGFRMTQQDLSDSPHLLIDGREIPEIPGSVSIPCHGGNQTFNVAFQRLSNGNPIIQPGEKKLVLDTVFTFTLKKMIYKGKPDY